ncbi:hypothetical protein BDZ89DRAFT_1073088 [Hymenopellis radicata]|nr:hypothetical protein BDZ89DRAFT_1073088 [Hymenopellis radicata]
MPTDAGSPPDRNKNEEHEISSPKSLPSSACLPLSKSSVSQRKLCNGSLATVSMSISSPSSRMDSIQASSLLRYST